MKILVATKNPSKLKEMREFLGGGFELISLADLPGAPEVEETGSTFRENALLKARAYFEWSGLPTIADDGGLEIDFLNGEPGVVSRRWPGYEATDQELIDMALEKLKGVSREKRTAHLTTVGAFYDGQHELSEIASIDGYITEEQLVDCNPGYPFRAIFWIPEKKCLYQHLTPEEHEEVNHRKVVYGRLGERIRNT